MLKIQILHFYLLLILMVFSWSSGGDNTQNGSYNYVAWCWKANGGVTSSNSDGSITTTLQVGKGF